MSSMPLDAALARLLDEAWDRPGPLIFLTGAGVSAESGIPTFRGPEGYWQVGSVNFHPMELATFEAFTEMPDEIWAWYLYRRGVCRAAAPNSAHLALVRLEEALADRFLLITQNIDGLHLRAGNSAARTYQIHGNVDLMRCAECGAIAALPDAIDVAWEKQRAVRPAERDLLVCAACGGRARPHVLWFDETYDEENFRFMSSLEAAQKAALLVVAGTSGATNLPHHVARTVAQRGAPMVVVNLEESPFTELAEAHPKGFVARGSAGEILPALAKHLLSRG